MGKDHGNEIFIHTAKSQYVASEVVTGAILLRLQSPLPAKSLVLQLKGKEVVEFEDWEYRSVDDGNGGTTQQRFVVTRDSKKDIFRQKITLLNWPGGFMPGCYAYPFSFQLPADLPGTFHKKKKGGQEGTRYSAKVFYKAKAVLDIPGTKHDLKCTQPFIIHQLFSTGSGSRLIEKEGRVMLMCCIPRGTVHVKASIEKDAYVAGELARVHVEVVNGSKSVITDFASKLIRVHDMEADGHSKRVTDTVSVFKTPGCAPGETKAADIDLALVSRKDPKKPIAPGVHSKHNKCRYYMSIEMQVAWAPDICIEVPVTIMPPIHQNWTNFAAPAWASQCQVQMVDPKYAMPQADAGAFLKGVLGAAFKGVFLEYK